MFLKQKGHVTLFIKKDDVLCRRLRRNSRLIWFPSWVVTLIIMWQPSLTRYRFDGLPGYQMAIKWLSVRMALQTGWARRGWRGRGARAIVSWDCQRRGTARIPQRRQSACSAITDIVTPTEWNITIQSKYKDYYWLTAQWASFVQCRNDIVCNLKSGVKTDLDTTNFGHSTLSLRCCLHVECKSFTYFEATLGRKKPLSFRYR